MWCQTELNLLQAPSSNAGAAAAWLAGAAAPSSAAPLDAHFRRLIFAAVRDFSWPWQGWADGVPGLPNASTKQTQPSPLLRYSLSPSARELIVRARALRRT